MTLRIHVPGDTLTVEIHSETTAAPAFARLLWELGAPPAQAGALGRILADVARLGVGVVTIGEPS